MNRSFLVFALALSSGLAPAQQDIPITGQWMIDNLNVGDQVHLTLHRSVGKFGNSTNSSAYPVNQLRGLARPQMESQQGSVVKFEIVRDAGTLVCEGYFKRGNGAGSFTFSPSPNFASEMQKLGYERLTLEKQFSMASHDVSLAYVRDLRSMNLAPASADDLSRARVQALIADGLVLVDGRPILSCLALPVECEGREVTTVEGLARDGVLHPLQQAFAELGAAQCGYCTPGFLLVADELLRHNPRPTRAQIAEALAGNLCRCTGYLKIFEAVELAVSRMGAAIFKS
jgi:aerobic-type carbon monoxide dehydrogenase small subunit (CoxS/CutS family)